MYIKNEEVAHNGATIIKMGFYIYIVNEVLCCLEKNRVLSHSYYRYSILFFSGKPSLELIYLRIGGYDHETRPNHVVISSLFTSFIRPSTSEV